jgi:raffinose/stachyose/melibiose transport system substrate-binding protein
MRKAVSWFLVLMLLCGVLTGCGSKSSSLAETRKTSDADFTADNDILIYDRPEEGKLHLTVGLVSTYYDGEINMLREFEKQNPDIDLIYYDITGGNDAYRPFDQILEHGDSPDILISSGKVEDTAKLEDLTDYEAVNNFDTATLMQSAVDGHIYYLPGPISFGSLHYNKALFDQYGWKVPATQDEFFALCRQITKDTNGQVTPFNINAKYPKELVNILLGMTYDDVLGGTDNLAWLHDFRAGKATFTRHMEPLFDLGKRFIEEGIINEDSFAYSATKIKEEFLAGKLAMCTIGANIEDADSFPDFPYPGKAAGEQTIMRSVNYWASVAKKDYTDEQQNAITKFINYFCEPETQLAFIGNTAMSTSTKNPVFPDSAATKELKAVFDAGRTFERESFLLDNVSAGNFMGINYIQQALLDMTTGARTESEAIQSVDDAAAAAIADPDAKSGEKVASASKDLTSLETSEMFADMFREKTGTDISLVLHGVTYRGNVMRIYAGDITKDMVAYLKPRSFDNDSTLVAAKMTGKQLKAALNDPLGEDGVSADCIYAFSGLKATCAPWNALGSKILSVTRTDGSAIDDNDEYSVSFWLGTVNEKYYDTASVRTVEGTFDEILTAYLTAGCRKAGNRI